MFLIISITTLHNSTRKSILKWNPAMAKKALKWLHHFCHTFGSPSQVAGDQGPQRFKASGGRGANEQIDRFWTPVLETIH